jgi:hypothetical protein
MKKLLIISTIFIISCSAEKSTEEKSSNETEDENPEECVYIRNPEDFSESKLFKKTKFIEVRSYEVAFEGVEFAEEPIDGDTAKVIDPRENYVEKIILNEQQKDSLFRLLRGFEKDLNPIGADCYWPRHMIAFYGKNDSLIGSIDICFECGQMYSDIEEFNFLCEDQLTYYFNFLKWCGLSKGFRE